MKKSGLKELLEGLRARDTQGGVEEAPRLGRWAGSRKEQRRWQTAAQGPQGRACFLSAAPPSGGLQHGASFRLSPGLARAGPQGVVMTPLYLQGPAGG